MQPCQSLQQLGNCLKHGKKKKDLEVHIFLEILRYFIFIVPERVCFLLHFARTAKD